MNHLKSLYLYGDEEPSQTEFIIEREKIAKELTEIEARLSELKSSDVDAPLSDDSMIKKASYFIMVEKLTNSRYVYYEDYIRKIDLSVPRNFLITIIDQIEVDAGQVVSIAFKNGMTHRFLYK